MFDVSSLTLCGINNQLEKSISGYLYLYIWTKGKTIRSILSNEKLENVGPSVYSTNTYIPVQKGKQENNRNQKIANRWNKYFCVIKANLLFLYEEKGQSIPQKILFLEQCSVQLSNYHFTVKKKIIEPNKEFLLEHNEELVELSFNENDDRCKYFFYTGNKIMLIKWKETLQTSSFSNCFNKVKILAEENEELKKELENQKKLHEIDLKNKDMELNNLQNQMKMMKLSLEKMETRNKRLQIAAEVNIKSTDEILQRKTEEMEIIHQKLGEQIEENMKLEEEKRKVKEAYSQKINEIEILKKNNKTLEKKIAKLISTYEEASGDPEKLTLINYNTNQRYQKMVVINKALKEETFKLNERFYTLEERYRDKIKTIKEVVEIGDIFDYLHKVILLCQTKIKYYEKCYEYNEQEEKEIVKTLENLIKETKISEANARVCYIKHRSKILEERLSHYLNKVPPSDYFYFANTTLRRLGWIFGEIEILKPFVGEHDETYPIYSYIDDMDIIPMREQIYYNEGIEGRASYNIVSDVDIYSFPTKMYPYEEKIINDNNYNYIKIKLTNLKNDFNILKKKTKPKSSNIISDTKWEEIQKNALNRLEKDMIILQQKTNFEK